MATNKNFIVKNGLDVSGTANLSTLNLTGALTGPASFTIDPAAVGDNTGTVIIAGNLQVDGTQTTINSTTMTVDDLNLTLASGAGNAAAANGAGLTVDGASATFTYANSDDSWAVNKRFKAQSDLRLGSDGVRLSTDGNGEFGVGYGQTATNNRFTVYNNTTAAFRVLPNGNVGIGTSSPNKTLDVEAPSGTATVANFRNPNGGWGQYAKARFQTDAKDTRFIELGYYRGTQESERAFCIDGQSSNRLLTIIETTGNVGIGVSAPSKKLHVEDSSTYQLQLDGGNNFWNVGAGFSGYYDGSFLIANNTGDKFTIDSNGKVGIGTPSPDAKLSVTSTTVNSEDILYLKSGADNVNDYLGIAWELGVGGNGPHSAIRSFAGPSGSDARLGFLTTSNGGTTLTEGLSIAHNGQVGIGTTTPAQPLHIYNGGGYWASVSKGNSTPGGTDPWLGLFNNINIASATYGWGIYDSSADGSFQIWNKVNNTTGSNTFTILRGGNVGIGTNAPIEKLDVSGYQGISVNQNYAHMGSTSSGAMAIFGHNIKSDSGTNILKSANSGYHSSMIKMYYNEGITFHATSGTQSAGAAFYDITGTTNELMRITNSGNVGIGTTSPAAALEVARGSAGYVAMFGAPQGAGKVILFKDNHASPNKYNWLVGTQYNTNNAFEITPSTVVGGYTFNAPAITVLQTGNVGIGTSSPDALFEVERAGSHNSSDSMARITGQTYPSLEFYSRDSNASNRNWKLSSVYNSYGTFEFLRSAAANGVPNITTLAMTNAGNVGIGTTSPFGTTTNRTCLSVNGTSSVSLNIGVGNAQKGYLYTDGNATQLGSVGNIPLKFAPNDSPKMELSPSGELSLYGNKMVIDSDHSHWTGRYQHLTCHNTITSNQAWTDVAYVSYSPSLTIQGIAQRDNNGGYGASSFLGTIFGGYGSTTVVAERSQANPMNGGGFGALEYRYLNGGASSGNYRLQVRLPISAGTMYVTTTLTGHAWQEIYED